MRHTAKEQKSSKRRIRFPGVIADARALQVHPRTLQRVLGGEWKSLILTARFKQLRGQPLTASERTRLEDFTRRQATKGPVPS